MSRARRHVTRALLLASAALPGLSASAAAPATSPARFEPEIPAFEAADTRSLPAPGGFARTTPAPDDPCRDLRQARSLIRAGDLPSAQRSLEACVGAAPQSAEGWLTLGVVHFAERHFDQAAAALEKSLELDATQPQAFKMLGRVHTARSKPALAERAFAEAGRLAPRDAEPRYLLGRLYQSEGRLVEAARYLKEAVALDPSSARAHAFLGSVSFGLGDDSLAQESFLRAVSLNQASPAPDAIPHLEYGIYLQRTNRLEESIVELRRAAQLDASSVDARFELGQSLHRLRRLKEANEALREALNLDGTEVRVHYLLGRVCYEQGDRGCGDEHMRLSERQRGR